MFGSRPRLQPLVARKDVRVEPLPNRPVEVQVMGTAFLDVLRARDISVGGLGVSVEHGFEGCDLSETVQLVIKLPDRKAFMARGIVRHTNAKLSLFGIEFSELSDSAKACIAEYVAQMKALGRAR